MTRPQIITAAPFRDDIIVQGDGLPVLGMDRRQALILIERLAAALAQPAQTPAPAHAPRVPRFPG